MYMHAYTIACVHHTYTSVHESVLVEKQCETIGFLEHKVKTLEKETNHLEQYSRKSHLRINGMKVVRGEGHAVDYKQQVSNFVSHTLRDKGGVPISLNPEDIDAAHPLPSKNPNDIPTIIVRFHAREKRDKVIAARRQLKDDTTLLANIHSTNPCNINQELQNVSTWFSTNKLSLNASKTKAITFHTPHHNITPPILNINNQPIENTNETNFLGITIDKHLNFKLHINKIATKLSRISGILNKLKHFVPHFTLKTIYQSLFIPHLTYSIMAWSKSPHSSQIVKIQKKAYYPILIKAEFFTQ
ncbi:hypothetical protein CAPTEDRAFT_194122 [Capitella teleta]|uniref:Reverse transcriptase domain-containing protein n=1 Tax=Capitella teleta TaxID=283909 RepID=R7TIF4_CAPTE|nr:hypothetical protein CAPTEDRAFT_194122 [Capitella teleta]|eukprot:ELT93519.1 hypothetical protein CAPTEDRAFT_194122 [Capitella teleta]